MRVERKRDEEYIKKTLGYNLKSLCALKVAERNQMLIQRNLSDETVKSIKKGHGQ